VIRYLISDGTYAAEPERWIERIERRIAEGIELIQIRERDLPVRELARLTRRVLALPNPYGTKILVNDRADVAMACGAHGVHLRDGSPRPTRVAQPGFMVTAACHDPAGAPDLEGADFAVLAPIFSPLSKFDQKPPLGTIAIREFVRRSSVPVLALGGITRENARACIDAGAAGIAGITYFER
jgi:thiamine-phosphate pyrophosphorylase